MAEKEYGLRVFSDVLGVACMACGFGAVGCGLEQIISSSGRHAAVLQAQLAKCSEITPQIYEQALKVAKEIAPVSVDFGYLILAAGGFAIGGALLSLRK